MEDNAKKFLTDRLDLGRVEGVGLNILALINYSSMTAEEEILALHGLLMAKKSDYRDEGGEDKLSIMNEFLLKTEELAEDLYDLTN